MNTTLILSIIALYFLAMMLISFLTTRKVDQQSFYNGNRRSPWYIIAIAMLGTSISGVTFVSVPGMVINSGFAYLQMVLGFVLGYLAVAYILLPLYYRLNLTSIYSYLHGRFGAHSYKTGASFFLISRTLGSAFRLYIVAVVLQKALFDQWQIPFVWTVTITILLIFLYTRKGGVKTVIWTDTVQTLVLLAAVVLCLFELKNAMNLSLPSLVKTIANSEMSNVWVWDLSEPRYFWKQFLAGVFTVITMTGLDQDQMQKNLSCRNLKDAQKNMCTYGVLFLPINIIFLAFGVLLVQYARQIGAPIENLRGDEIFPFLATQMNPETGRLFLGTGVSVLFILGIISAAYSSADSALTALTTSFTVDILGVKNEDPKLMLKRNLVHVGLSGVMIVVITWFHWINDASVIDKIYAVAGYTYGPLLGLFAFGMTTKWTLWDKGVPYLCMASPVLSYWINTSVFDFGFAILIVNGLITYTGLIGLSLLHRMHQHRHAANLS